MKIVSWNVNGFRSSLKSGFLDWFKAEDPDVLSLQEIRVEWARARPDDAATELSAKHDVCWFPARRRRATRARRRWRARASGFTHTKGLGSPEVRRRGAHRGERAPGLHLRRGVLPQRLGGARAPAFKRRFSKDLTEAHGEAPRRGEHAVVVGDMNVAPEEIDLANPKSNRGSPGFTDEEREDFRGYLKAGLRDVLRERHPGEKGLYSWWSQRGGARAKNVGWRIDIFLVSEGLAAKVTRREDPRRREGLRPLPDLPRPRRLISETGSYRWGPGRCYDPPQQRQCFVEEPGSPCVGPIGVGKSTLAAVVARRTGAPASCPSASATTPSLKRFYEPGGIQRWGFQTEVSFLTQRVDQVREIAAAARRGRVGGDRLRAAAEPHLREDHRRPAGVRRSGSACRSSRPCWRCPS
jgi:exodeoxyribonuclease-3